MNEGRVEELYTQLKELVVIFRIKPGERINEGALAKELNASRTPLREALNRLVAEQLVEFFPGKGFFCRELDPQSIFELYEARETVEIDFDGFEKRAKTLHLMLKAIKVPDLPAKASAKKAAQSKGKKSSKGE